jgi:hypothetical protein
MAAAHQIANAQMRSSTILTFRPSRAACQILRQLGDVSRNLCAASHSGGRKRATFSPVGGRGVASVSVKEAAKAAVRTRLRNALPLVGLCVAVIVNVAWIGFLGYFVLRLV